MRILALMPDSYDAPGGIAQYSRDLVDALCDSSRVERVVSLPRHAARGATELPSKLSELPTPGNPLRYVAEAHRRARETRPDVIFCGHANLLPVAALLKRAAGARLILQTHGVEIWGRGGPVRARAIRSADCVLAVSRYTRARLLDWSGIEPHRVRVIPNTIRLERFRPGPRPDYLVERYGVRDRTVLLTLGRLSDRERYKGHDRIIGLLPELAQRVPNVVYVIAGDGDDRPRLEALARERRVEDRVVFAGHVPDGARGDYYNLADAFAMPSTGEGFGIVFLEAAACGTPVLGGAVDGSRDALCEGDLGVMVDPRDARALLDALTRVLAAGRGVPVAVERFAFPRFRGQVERAFVRVAEGGRAA
jgi:glycosyltransferase involved in cell wall biosynthesis